MCRIAHFIRLACLATLFVVACCKRVNMLFITHHSYLTLFATAKRRYVLHGFEGRGYSFEVNIR